MKAENEKLIKKYLRKLKRECKRDMEEYEEDKESIEEQSREWSCDFCNKQFDDRKEEVQMIEVPLSKTLGEAGIWVDKKCRDLLEEYFGKTLEDYDPTEDSCEGCKHTFEEK